MKLHPEDQRALDAVKRVLDKFNTSRLAEPRLLAIAGAGLALLAFLFAGCWNGPNDSRGNPYHRDRMLCSGGMDDLRLWGIPYAWILAVAICLILFALYRYLGETRRGNSN
jgi:hypothetical protein